jgi:hypothetical protein
MNSPGRSIVTSLAEAQASRFRAMAIDWWRHTASKSHDGQNKASGFHDLRHVAADESSRRNCAEAIVTKLPFLPHNAALLSKPGCFSFFIIRQVIS